MVLHRFVADRSVWPLYALVLRGFRSDNLHVPTWLVALGQHLFANEHAKPASISQHNTWHHHL